MKLKLAISALCLLCVLFSGFYVRKANWKRIAFASVRESDTRRLSDVLPYIDINATQKGANVVDDLTLLNVAVVESTPEIVKLLLENGADPNDRNAYEGLTPLHRAVYYQRENPRAAVIIEMLLEYGADPSLRTESGHLAEEWACKGDRISELLELRTDFRSDPGITKR